MRVVIFIFLAILALLGNMSLQNNNTSIDKIIRAKEIVLTRLNYPETADFHDMKTKIEGNNVTIVVTAKNAFGVPSTETFTINVP